jgi:hypothetical protein
MDRVSVRVRVRVRVRMICNPTSNPNFSPGLALCADGFLLSNPTLTLTLIQAGPYVLKDSYYPTQP